MGRSPVTVVLCMTSVLHAHDCNSTRHGNPGHAVQTMGLQRCPIKGLDTEYIVPPGCDHFAEHVQVRRLWQHLSGHRTMLHRSLLHRKC